MPFDFAQAECDEQHVSNRGQVEVAVVDDVADRQRGQIEDRQQWQDDERDRKPRRAALCRTALEKSANRKPTGQEEDRQERQGQPEAAPGGMIPIVEGVELAQACGQK